MPRYLVHHCPRKNKAPFRIWDVAAQDYFTARYDNEEDAYVAIHELLHSAYCEQTESPDNPEQESEYGPTTETDQSRMEPATFGQLLGALGESSGEFTAVPNHRVVASLTLSGETYILGTATGDLFVIPHGTSEATYFSVAESAMLRAALQVAEENIRDGD